VKLQSKFFFLFDMTNGKKKLGYGDDPEDAYAVLALRLKPPEMALIIKDKWVKVAHLDLQKIVGELG